MIISSKIEYAFHVMNYVAAGKSLNGCTMNEIYVGESIPREYADAIMIELAQKGFLLNEDKVNGRFKLAKPWNESASRELAKLMSDLWCWPSTISGNHKKRSTTKKANSHSPVTLKTTALPAAN